MSNGTSLLVVVSVRPREDAALLARDYDLVWCASWRDALPVFAWDATQRFLLIDSIEDHDALEAIEKLTPLARSVHTVVAAHRPSWLRAALRQRGLFAEVLRAPVAHEDLMPRIGVHLPGGGWSHHV